MNFAASTTNFSDSIDLNFLVITLETWTLLISIFFCSCLLKSPSENMPTIFFLVSFIKAKPCFFSDILTFDQMKSMREKYSEASPYPDLNEESNEYSDSWFRTNW